MKALILGIVGALVLSGTALGVGIDDDGCLKCHRLKGLSVVDSSNRVKDCSVSDALYTHSVHRNVGCTECHDQVEQYPHKPENVAANCANKCHVADPSTKKPFLMRISLRPGRKAFTEETTKRLPTFILTVAIVT